MSRFVRLLALVAFGSTAGCGNGTRAASIAVFGNIWTGDSARPAARAIAMRGDSIVAVGDSLNVAKLVDAKTRVFHAGLGLVVPGFGDSHVYFTDRGLQLSSIDLHDAASPAEFIRRVAAFASQLKPGEWILGGMWDHERWPRAPLPSKTWIDSVTADHPLFLQRIDGHTGIANSRALALAHIDRHSPAVAGGAVQLDAAGEPTGILKDDAMELVFAAIPPPAPEQADSLLARAMRAANAHGVTAVSLMSSAAWEVGAVRRAAARGTLTVRMTLYPPLNQWREVADSVKAHGPGDSWVRVAGVKGSVDGSLGSTTAYFFGPYLDEPRSRGLMVTPEDSLRRWIGGADSVGLQVSVHAIGDRANALLLHIYDSVAQAHGPRDRRFRIEHAQHLRAEDIPRFGAQGIFASMQPGDVAMDGQWAGKRIRPEQLATSYAFRSLLDVHAHLMFGAGSDWLADPPNPLFGIWSATTRQTLDGKHPDGWFPEQRITIDEALRAYTLGNAAGVFAENDRGTLSPGKRADLIIIDRDIRSISADSLRQAAVRLTIVSGKVIFENR